MEKAEEAETKDAMEQELMLKASFIEKQSNELSDNIEYLNRQIGEMNEFAKDIKFLSDAKSNEAFSSLGKGIFMKTLFQEKDLFVEIGSGIVVRKTAEETRKIIEDKIRELFNLKTRLVAQLELYDNLLRQTIDGIGNLREKGEKKAK
jgi:prefoldin alpha subunit